MRILSLFVVFSVTLSFFFTTKTFGSKEDAIDATFEQFLAKYVNEDISQKTEYERFLISSGIAVFMSHNTVWEKIKNQNFDELPPLTQRFFVEWQINSIEFHKSTFLKYINSNNKRISNLSKKIVEVITKANANYSALIGDINQVTRMDENSQFARQQLTKRIKNTIKINSLLFGDLKFDWENEYNNYKALNN